MSDTTSRHPNPADRAAASLWARNLLRTGAFVVVDTETNGLAENAEAVQIAVVAPSGKVLLQALVAPTCPIPESVTAIHGITDQDVQDAALFSHLLPALRAVLLGKVAVAYNAAFDRRILEQSARARECEMPPGRWECAMLEYARWVGECGPRGGYRWQKLPHSGEHQAHSAVGDCLAVLDLMREMAKGVEEEREPETVEDAPVAADLDAVVAMLPF